MFPHTILSEAASLVAMGIAAFAALLFSERRSALFRRLLFCTVGAGLLGWLVLLISGLSLESEGPMRTVHGLVGHLLLPVVAAATGLWLGSSIREVKRRPARFLLRLALLLVLCFLCFSNTRTGYLGPSRVDPSTNAATEVRFKVFHQVAFPGLIGLALALWFGRLVKARSC